MFTFRSPTVAEINLGALAQNCRELKRLTARSARMMAVVKANGYGHGAPEVAKVTLSNGAEYLAVARFSEAHELRSNGIDAPILLFGFCCPAYVDPAIRNDIRLSLNTLRTSEVISAEAVRLHKKVKVHIKVDSGMGRLGIICDGLVLPENGKKSRKEAVNTILKIASMPGLEIEGIYTHFASADCQDKGHATFQFAVFSELLDGIKKQGLEIPLRHAANSAATIEMPETHLDMVRPGIGLYGLWPSNKVDKRRINLKPVMEIKSTIIQVKEVPTGFKVSYGSTFITDKRTRIATVPIGYADGYNRSLSSKGFMLVNGQRAPVIGRICMDLTLIDVSSISGVKPNDQVTVIGKQGSEEISVDEIARLTNTINYEVVSSIALRVSRKYSSN